MKLRMTTLLLCSFIGFDRGSYGASEDTSLRELCRKSISGQYISTYDRVYNAKNQVKHYAKKEKELLKYISENQAEYKKKLEATKTKEYNATALNEKDQAKAKLDASNSQLKDLKDLKAKAIFDLDDYSKKLASMDRNIKTIFVIQKLQEKEYPIFLKYKSSCPKYRFMCKLPKQDVKYLKKIASSLEAPQACERYISFSNTSSD